MAPPRIGHQFYLLMDEVGHVCDIVGLEGEELEIAQEIVALLKKISRMCGQELRGFNMFGWFISQTATGLAWLRKNAMTVIAHKVLMMSERKLACNEDMQIARSMDTWPVGRIMVYGLDFPDGSMILQQPVVTPRIVDADPPAMEPLTQKTTGQSFTPGATSVNGVNESGNEREMTSQAMPLRLVRSPESPVTVYETGEGDAEKKVDTSKVGNETRAIIVRLYNAKPPMLISKIAEAVGLTVANIPSSRKSVKSWASRQRRKQRHNMKLFGQGGVFDFSTPDFDGINAKLERLNEIEDSMDAILESVEDQFDLTDEQNDRGQELLDEKWQLFKELEGKVICVDVDEEEEERPWWKVW